MTPITSLAPPLSWKGLLPSNPRKSCCRSLTPPCSSATFTWVFPALGSLPSSLFPSPGSLPLVRVKYLFLGTTYSWPDICELLRIEGLRWVVDPERLVFSAKTGVDATRWIGTVPQRKFPFFPLFPLPHPHPLTKCCVREHKGYESSYL